MDETKYQVFVSSTYSDLINERKQVLDILLMADCIPAGMESFVATDDEQFNVIKKVIDLCDYYILIIGKRYGSVNEKTCLSYTEMEYNYAMDKGVPVLVFAIDDSVEVAKDKTETDAIKLGKLAEFKSRAMRNRLASVWTSPSDLIGKVAISIMQAKNEIKRPGWHRGVNTKIESLEKEINFLKDENEKLKLSLSCSNGMVDNKKEILDQRKKTIDLHYSEIVYVFTSNTTIKKKTITITLKDIFKFISLRLTGVKKTQDFIEAVSSYQSGYYVNTQDALILRNQLEQLSLFDCYIGKNDIEMIRLTDLGKTLMNELNSNP